jgi:hypothetical protein
MCLGIVLNVLGLEANDEKITEMWDEQQRNHQRRFAAMSVGGASGGAHEQFPITPTVGSPTRSSATPSTAATTTATGGVGGIASIRIDNNNHQASTPSSRTTSQSGASISSSRTASSPAAAALVAAASSSSRTVSSPRGLAHNTITIPATTLH